MCHKDYHKVDPDTGTSNLPAEREVTVVATASNFATDQVCMKRAEEFFGGDGATAGKTFFNEEEQEKHSVYFLRYHGMYDKVRAESCRVRQATFMEIIDSVPHVELPPSMQVDKTEHDDEKQAAEQALEDMLEADLANDQKLVNQLQQKMAKHAKNRALLVNKLFDGVLEHISFDVIACTLSMAMDIKLRHPHINVRTVIIDEISQATLDQVMGVKDLLHTRFEDPVLAMFGDSAQMPPTHNVGGRLDKLLNLDLMALRTDPYDCIPKAFGMDPETAWDSWGVDEPKPNVEGCQLEVNYRNPEVMSGLLMHNYYLDDNHEPKFHTAEALQPRINRTFADDADAANNGFHPSVREILDPGSHVFRNPFIPWLVRGVPVAFWDVCRSQEAQRLTSKSNDVIVDAVINMIYILCYKMRVILPENLTVLTSYMGQKLDIEDRIKGQLDQLCGEFVATEYNSSNAQENIAGAGVPGGWYIRQHATMTQVTVETWDSCQGREFPYVIVTDPRAMSEERESRTVSTGAIIKAQNLAHTLYPNTPVIDHELLEKEFPSHLDVVLGFTNSRHKFIVSNSRAKHGVFYLYDSHSRDLSPDWYRLTRWFDINGLTTFDYPQEVENALAYSPHPPKWYANGDMLMQGIDVVKQCGYSRTNLATARDFPVVPYSRREEDMDPYKWPKDFFRQLPEIKYKDFLQNGEIIHVVRTRPRMQDVTITRKDWNMTTPEPEDKFNEWREQNYIRPYDDLEPQNEGDANMKAVLTEMMPEDVEVWRVEQAKKTEKTMDTSEKTAGEQGEGSDGEPDVEVMSDSEEEEELEMPVAELPTNVATQHFNVVLTGHKWRGAWSHPRFLQAVRQMKTHVEQFRRLGQLPKLPDSHETLYRQELKDMVHDSQALLAVLIPLVGELKHDKQSVLRQTDQVQFAKIDYLFNRYRYTQLAADAGIQDMEFSQVSVANTPTHTHEGALYMLPYSPEQDNFTTGIQLTKAKKQFVTGIVDEVNRRKRAKAEAELNRLRGQARAMRLDGRSRERPPQETFMSAAVGGSQDQQQRGRGRGFRGRGRGTQQQQPGVRAQGPKGPQQSFHARGPMRGSTYRAPMVRGMQQPPHQPAPRWFQQGPILQRPMPPWNPRVFAGYQAYITQQQVPPPRVPGAYAPPQPPPARGGLGGWRAPQQAPVRPDQATYTAAQIRFNLGQLAGMGTPPRQPRSVQQLHEEAMQYLAQQAAQQQPAQPQPQQQLAQEPMEPPNEPQPGDDKMDESKQQ